jgi:hypothetical protein
LTLTAALAIVAGLVLALVVAHGAWNARRANPRQAHPTPPIARSEPMLPQAPAAEAPAVAALEDAPDPAAARRGPRNDAIIDAQLARRLEAPLSGESVLAHAPPSRRAGSKPFLLEGLNAETGVWEPVAAGQRYSELQAGVQLANRSGALNEIEYSEFAQAMQGFADHFGAMLELPDMLEVAARAKELDSFASLHDAQLTVTLRANGVAWSPGYLQQIAARHGFVPGPVPGRLVQPAREEHAPPVLVLSFDAHAALADEPELAALREAALSLDVPQTAEGVDPFAAWQQAARKLADDMDATLVDDQGQPVTLHAFTLIGGELKQMYRALESRDLAAGSASARRLFS